MHQKTVKLFCMGRELLEGMVLDRNAHFMANHATQLGYRVRSIQVLDEVESEVVAAFRAAVDAGIDYAVVTGGMGPGADDIARECLAKAAGVGTAISPQARNFLAASYRRLVAKGVVEDAELTSERLKMAAVPEGSTVYENTGGTAPVVELKVGNTTFFLMPGQPEELRRLFVQVVQPRLEQDGPGGLREVVHIDYPGGDESLVSRLLGDLSRRHPAVHGRARMQGTEDALAIRITLSVEGSDRADLHTQLSAATADLRARLGLEVPRGNRAAGG